VKPKSFESPPEHRAGVSEQFSDKGVANSDSLSIKNCGAERRLLVPTWCGCNDSLHCEPELLESLLEGLELGLRFPFFLPSLGSLFSFSPPSSRNFATGDPSRGPLGGFTDCILSVLWAFLGRSLGKTLRLVLVNEFREWALGDPSYSLGFPSVEVSDLSSCLIAI
jgi:hypothetical protein